MHEPSRRAVIAGTAAVAVTGCATYGAVPPPPAPALPPSTPLAKVADIPVGGGSVFPEQLVVVTQPEAGAFHAFSAVCTHQGCTVADVAGGTINCRCHGSKYGITDGAPVEGPAKRPLDPRQVTVAGEDLTLA